MPVIMRRGGDQGQNKIKRGTKQRMAPTSTNSPEQRHFSRREMIGHFSFWDRSPESLPRFFNYFYYYYFRCSWQAIWPQKLDPQTKRKTETKQKKEKGKRGNDSNEFKAQKEGGEEEDLKNPSTITEREQIHAGCR